MRRIQVCALVVLLAVAGFIAWSAARFVDGGRDFCSGGTSADLSWWPPRYSCPCPRAGAGESGGALSATQWDVAVAPAAFYVCVLVMGSWILLLRWKPAAAWLSAALTWAALTLVCFPLLWGQAGDGFCEDKGRSFEGPTADFYPPTFTCKFVRPDGSVFTRDYHYEPLGLVVAAAAFGLLGVIGFGLAAWPRATPFRALDDDASTTEDGSRRSS